MATVNAREMTEDTDNDLPFGDYEGMCQACDVWTALNDIGLCEELSRVRRLHRTAIENAYVLSRLSQAGDQSLANRAMDFLGDLRGRSPPRPDRPNGLVRYHEPAPEPIDRALGSILSGIEYGVEL